MNLQKKLKKYISEQSTNKMFDVKTFFELPLEKQFPYIKEFARKQGIRIDIELCEDRKLFTPVCDGVVFVRSYNNEEGAISDAIHALKMKLENI